MKKIVTSIFILMFMVGCSAQDSGELTRVDVQKGNKQENYEDTLMITDEKTINLLKSSFGEVKWEPNTKPEMSRKEDISATLFYTFDENMPERLYEYRIWFNGNDTATIISNNEKEGYGTLDLDNSRILKNNLLNYHEN
ncbi:hypothetical protein [Metabacillus sediminilitoris]|uniref:Lipoprotein n=1 Tax=Metabacillus sediminilitoris TaxID=2567941 RepID=A0A4S4BIB9_9BACI|nr:hypothetical protein [Metabacillus sediminilitoris]QGQ45796.1 hypothetical protein GMB29_11460 [Metabacillus sediminilitoris]THF74352.1 hypothetical protein E6W99_25500 [Metabacillus sediminilitoris]